MTNILIQKNGAINGAVPYTWLIIVAKKCGKKKEIFQIHHKHYATLFHERFKDVEVLCISCHRKADKDRKYWAAYETWAYKKYGENWAYCDDESLRDEFDAWLDSKQ